MTQSAAEILGLALALPEKDRARIAEMLTASLAPEMSHLHPSWGPEARRRAEEVQSGKVKPIAWEEIYSEISAKIDSGSN
jgi:putative addiction module component (TIGR02574 family)